LLFVKYQICYELGGTSVQVWIHLRTQQLKEVLTSKQSVALGTQTLNRLRLHEHPHQAPSQVQHFKLPEPILIRLKIILAGRQHLRRSTLYSMQHQAALQTQAAPLISQHQDHLRDRARKDRFQTQQILRPSLHLMSIIPCRRICHCRQ
jgi:hypothetical protein